MSFLWSKKEKGEKNEDPRRKDFRRLVSSLPRWPRKQFENGIPCFYYTYLIRLKSLEMGYLKYPDLVNKYFRLCRPIRCEGNFISISGKYAYYLEELFLRKLGLKSDRDYFFETSSIYFPDYKYNHNLSEEELDREARSRWEGSLISFFFDFVKIQRNYIVIRPKPNLDAILDNDELYQEIYQEIVGNSRASIAEEARRRQAEDERRQWEEFRQKRAFSQIDFKDLTVCSTCGKIYGKVQVDNKIIYQDCDCHKYPAPPDSEKRNRYRLCHYCGLEVFEVWGRYYGGWRVLGCPKCKEDVDNFKKFFKIDDLYDSMPREIYRCIKPYLSYHYGALEEVWLKIVVRRNLALLRLFEDIPLDDYLFLAQKKLQWLRFLNFRDRILFYFHFLDVKNNPHSFFPIILPSILVY
jgi:hypothetical protein